jgi:hypothetical protein
MSGCADRLWALCDADRQFFRKHPRRTYRTRPSSIEEVQGMPPHGFVVEQPYSAVLRRVNGRMQKLIVPELVIATLPETKAKAVWEYWPALSRKSYLYTYARARARAATLQSSAALRK